MKFEIKNRWNGSVIFTAGISCDENASLSLKLGLAVKAAAQAKADLSDADLSGANLSGANLSGANLRAADLRAADLRAADLSDADLSGANLSDADLSGANLSDADLSDADLRAADLSDADLSDANLRRFKSCLWMTLTQYRDEVPNIVEALEKGRVNGSKYEGECACLVGTIANSRGVDASTLHQNSSDPSEQWFLMIKEGDTPESDTPGGCAAKLALEWIKEWQSLQPHLGQVSECSGEACQPGVDSALEAPELPIEFLTKCSSLNARIVSSGDLNELQIAECRQNGRFFVDEKTGLGWGILPFDLTTGKDRLRETGFLNEQEKAATYVGRV